LKHAPILRGPPCLMSPPARGRGLKRIEPLNPATAFMSPPARGRGLKHELEERRDAACGRPPRGGVD